MRIKGAPPRRPGATVEADGVRFVVFAPRATSVELCLFDDDAEMRLPMRRDGDWHEAFIAGATAGQRYGLRADGPWDPAAGDCFDPAKLLVDPYATRLDRAFVHAPELALPRTMAVDTARFVPKAIVEALAPLVDARPAGNPSGGLIYEINPRAMTMRHQAIAPAQRGTLAALAHPAIVDHVRGLGVDAVELMPVAAWIDERHLPPLGLANAWGYNPVTFCALDPRLAPGGIADLRKVVAAYHAAGIAVLLDIVLNHTGESDERGATLSLRGLGEAEYYRRGADGKLANDTGCGNTLAFDRAPAADLAIHALRHFVLHAGVDGFRFDLAPVLSRDGDGVRADAPFFQRMAADPVLMERTLIAEPWDIGPGGYRLGAFPDPVLEWNDRFRDDVRRFWRGDPGTRPALATRLAGSSDIFRGAGTTATRSVNFVTAHDGFTLADLVSYRHRRNEANGEHNRDGHGENFSWNCGVEGPSDDPAVIARRMADRRALLSTLFAARGTLLLVAGDESGRTQGGNNNAYAQANDVTWLDWTRRDSELEGHVAALSAFRRAHPALSSAAFLHGDGAPVADVVWFGPDGAALAPADWDDADAAFLGAAFATADDRVAICIHRGTEPAKLALPAARAGHRWEPALGATPGLAPARTVSFFVEVAA